MGFVPNDRQRQAIEHVHGPMLVVAGAGTGKTTVLVERFVRAVCDEGLDVESVLVIKGTRERMRSSPSLIPRPRRSISKKK